MDTDTIKMVSSFAAKKVMAWLAGALITLGVLHTGPDETGFVTVGSGIVVGLVSLVWSWWNDRGKQLVLAKFSKAHGIVAKTASVATAANAIQAAVKTDAVVPDGRGGATIVSVLPTK